MKKCLMAGAFLMSVLSLSAQETEKSQELFLPHWYMQVQIGAAHTVGEADFSDLLSPAAALNVGYRFNPLFGLRAGVSGWQAKGGWVTPAQDYKYKYVQGNVDAVLDLSTLFCRYNPRRVFNAYAFLGVAFNHAFDNGAEDLVLLGDHKLEYLWNDTKNSFAGRGGLGANIRLNDRLALNIEGNANLMTDKFNSKKAGNPDWQFNALVGLTITFGKSHRTVEPVYTAPAPVEEPAPVAVVPEKKEEPKPVVQEEKREQYRCDIFFLINSSEIRASEASKIDGLVRYLQRYPDAKAEITGYADAGTGNARVNLRLSEQRAQAVKEALVKAGVDETRIISDYKGDSVQPFADNDQNRVTICIAE